MEHVTAGKLVSLATRWDELNNHVQAGLTCREPLRVRTTAARKTMSLPGNAFGYCWPTFGSAGSSRGRSFAPRPPHREILGIRHLGT
jgi:hypothetical protein